VEFTAGQALYDKLAQLKDLLRHQVPDGELATLVERAVDLLIEDSMKRRFAQTRSPKPHTSKPHPPKPHTAKSHTAPSSMPAAGSASTSAAAGASTSAAAGASTSAAAGASTSAAGSASTPAATSASFGISGRGATTSTAKNSLARSARVRSSRYIPRAVVREVYQRDAGQCTFVSAEGKRCSERGFLELHHHDPYARGGEATVENLRLVCRPHNALFAERDFGRSFIRSKRTQTREPVDELGLERVVQP
jgi:hypothetical protein